MKKKIAIFIVILIIGLIFIGFKSYNLYAYETKQINCSIGNELNIKEQSTKNNYSVEKLSFFLDNTYKTSYDKNTYTKQNINNAEEMQTITFNVVHNIIKNTCVEDINLDTYDYMDLLKKYKINNEIDLIKYYTTNKDKKLNVITSLSEIKTIYLANKFIEKLNITGDINLLTTLDGYLTTDNDNTIVVVFNNSNMYKITFSKNYNQEEVEEIISTFKFI